MVADPRGNRNFDGQRPKARSILAAGYGPGGQQLERTRRDAPALPAGERWRQPTMTIQALAFRAGEHIAAFARRGEI